VLKIHFDEKTTVEDLFKEVFGDKWKEALDETKKCITEKITEAEIKKRFEDKVTVLLPEEQREKARNFLIIFVIVG